ncbi:Uncharacterized protein BP5553_07229 [Venustampulla echinocandica]|uniref:Uncharacterized protein n=1 Tax=Venustampulla echinocandica TaxID=2656787 RepID=A0A370TIX6_9HELO|nr:Uncharacterized protein BP5553_07229 [Venustampulla echinocandica]RDL35298.1 Uncharacterized protein BP5553_07229 [Venustampulla echinocandica]
MILMEGMLSAPPERSTIIGRAVWKPRYVVLGTGAHLKTQTNILSESSRRSSTARKGALKSPSSKPSLVDVAQSEPDGQERQLYISVYKAKVGYPLDAAGNTRLSMQGDWEFISQHPLSAFKSCEVRTLQHRKQGPTQPTLVLEMKPGSASDKQRKRRSSRTPGLASSKDPWANALIFRTVESERHSIYNWQSCIGPKLTSETPEDSPLTPASPLFNMFSNPFGSRDSKTTLESSGRSDFQRGPSSQATNTYPQSPRDRDRPTRLISPSPSLRSRRSDLSSQASSLHPPMGFTSHSQNYSPTLPPDLPSPASTAYDTQFIEGWTSAQGRSSALSSHTRGSNSIASAVMPMGQVASTSPVPRETILDRAFQMRYIPGSDRATDKEDEKISSIARFEALMKEVDERKKQRAVENLRGSNKNQGWDLDETLEISDPDTDNEDDDDDDGLEMSDHNIAIQTPAQRALDYIAGRAPPATSSRPKSPPTPRSPIPFLNPQAMSAFHDGPSANSGLRPRTGTTSSRNRTSRPSSMALPPRSLSTAAVPTLKDCSNLKASPSDDKEKRRSSTSAKRLSFQEFTKRLSSTSSLLLVQTNASSSSGRDGSRRTSSEYGFESEDRFRGSVMGSTADRSSMDKRCGWRGSVGVFGGEGGFL